MPEQKVSLITGASRGIGRSIAIDLAKEHFSVALVGRDAAALQEVADICTAQGVQAKIYAVDMRDTAQLSALIDKVNMDLGGINVLVNNAGIFLEKPLEQFSEQEIDDSFQVNLKAVFTLTRKALPHLIGREQAAIINIGSVAGERGYANGTAYTATKFGINGFSESLFQEVRQRGIKVSTINPGLVNTDMHKGDPHYTPENMIQPEDIARAVSFVINFPGTACPTEITILPQKNPRKVT